MESRPQNPEFRNNPENFHPWFYKLLTVTLFNRPFIKLTPDGCTFELRHEISNNAVPVCATSKASDQPAHMRSLIRAFASRLNIL